jgi:hypothetical protein
LASAISSLTLLAASLGVAVITMGEIASSETPVRSFSVSKGMFLRRLGLITWLVTTRPMVWPSGCDLATKSVPSTVPAPALYCTITGCFQVSLRWRSSRRARMSTAPPGAFGTMIVTGLLGKVPWAEAARGRVAQAAAAISVLRKVRFMAVGRC